MLGQSVCTECIYARNVVSGLEDQTRSEPMYVRLICLSISALCMRFAGKEFGAQHLPED
jgi:hypothetical protein